MPEIARAFLLNVKIFCIAEAFILVLRAAARGDPQPAGAGVLPAARARDRLRRLLPRRADDPRDRAARLRRPGARSSTACRPRPSFWGIVALVLVYTAYVAEVYRAGIESVHPSQEAAARSLGLTHAQSLRLRDPAAGGAPRDPAAAERLHRPAEGHGARRHARRRSRRSTRRRSTSNATFNFTPYLAAAVLFVAITIPLARLHRLARRARPPPPAGGRRAHERRCCAVEGVRKSFGKLEVLRGIDLAVAEHEVVCLIGASGSGKSTLLRCVNLLEPIDAGRIVARRRGDHRAGRRRRPRPAADRDRLPGVQPLPAHDGAAERHARAAQGARPSRAPRPRRAPPSCSRRFGLADKATSTPTGCRAASSSASRSCARSRWSPS